MFVLQVFWPTLLIMLKPSPTVSLRLFPKILPWFFPLIYSFLSIPVTQKENLNVFLSALQLCFRTCLLSPQASFPSDPVDKFWSWFEYVIWLGFWVGCPLCENPLHLSGLGTDTRKHSLVLSSGSTFLHLCWKKQIEVNLLKQICCKYKQKRKWPLVYSFSFISIIFKGFIWEINLWSSCD